MVINAIKALMHGTKRIYKSNRPGRECSPEETSDLGRGNKQ